MKKGIIATLLMGSSLFCFSQASPIEASLCGVHKGEMTIAEIENCGKIVLEDKTLEVQSYRFSMLIGMTEVDGKMAANEVVEFNVKGTDLDERVLTHLKEKNPDKIFLEHIKSTNKEGKEFNHAPIIVKIKKYSF